MPNWVYNTLAISNEHRSKIINDKNEVDFNIAVPMPESLNCDSGSMNAPAIYAYLSRSNTIDLYDMKKDEFAKKILKNKYRPDSAEEEIEFAYNTYRKMIEGHPEQNDILYKEGQVLVENFRNYGYTTWYEWCCDKWGCKWNAGDITIGDVDKENKLKVRFHTPWSHPTGWLKALCDAGVPFYLEWIEEQGYHGEVISDGKTITENKLDFIDDAYDVYPEGEPAPKTAPSVSKVKITRKKEK